MSLKSVWDKLKDISETSGSLAKEAQLAVALEDDLFLRVVQYALDPRKKFKTKKMPAYNEEYSRGTVEQLFSMLDQLALQKGASAKDKNTLSLIASIDVPTYEVVQRIVNGDLRCGIGTKSVNKVRPKTVPFTAYLRCSSKRQLHKARFPAIWQVKANGKYAEMKCTEKLLFGSRDSHKLKNLKHLKKMYKVVRDKFGHNVYMGELRVWNKDGTIMGRQKGNGLINTKNLDKNTAKRIFYSLWDCIPYCDYIEEKCLIPYDVRLDNVRAMVSAIAEEFQDNTSFAVIESFIVKDMELAQELTNKEIAKGGEGGVLKNTDATWKHGTSLDQFKMKRSLEAEVRVLAWEYGDKGKKNEHRMGRILLGTDDGRVKTYCGGGFSDKRREEDWDKHIGRIVEVVYEEVTLARGATVYALSGPAAFVDFRDGRDKTDTYEDLSSR